ncbi:MAG TPA: hypothetical protein VK681_38990 [Reyranella sp.]|nr:hypothetical protein [Reyranella sp.]
MCVWYGLTMGGAVLAQVDRPDVRSATSYFLTVSGVMRVQSRASYRIACEEMRIPERRKSKDVWDDPEADLMARLCA